MVYNIYGVNLSERKGSQRVMVRDDGSIEGVRNFFISWGYRWAAVYALKGFPHTLNSLDSFAKPDAFPDHSDLVCVEATFDGFGTHSSGNSGEIEYQMANIVATYRVPPYAVEGPTAWMEENLDFGAEFLRAPEGTYKWKSDQAPVEQGVGILVGAVERSYTLHRVDQIDKERFRNAVGKVNNAAFLGVPKHQLRLDGIAVSRTHITMGLRPYVVTFRFMEQDHSFNKFLRPQTGDWEEIEPNPYGEYDMGNLLPGD